jgi:hypothetical protein
LESNSVMGTWKLVSWQHERPKSDDTFAEVAEPQGRIIYGADGQMAVVITSASRPRVGLAGLLASFTRRRGRGERLAIAYSGTYETKGTEVVHHVEVSTVPEYAGQDLTRTFLVQGHELQLSYIGPVGKGVMIWRRLG